MKLQQLLLAGLIAAAGCKSHSTIAKPDNTKTSNPGNTIKVYKTNGTDDISDIRSTTDGGYILAGATNATVNGKNDAYIIKTDAAGNIQWAKTYGGKEVDDFKRIRVTPDGGYIAVGSTFSYHHGKKEAYVVKTDAKGDVQWAHAIGFDTEHGDRGMDVIVLKNGGYAIGASYDFAPATADWAVIRLAADGNIIWARRYGNSYSDDGGFLVEDGENLLMSAYTYSDTYYDGVLVKLNGADGKVLGVNRYDIDGRTNIFLTINKVGDDFLVTNVFANAWGGSNAHNNLCVMRVNKEGQVVNVRAFDSLTQNPFGTDGGNVTVTADGGYMAVESQGELNAPKAVYWSKADAAGEITWSEKVGSASDLIVCATVAGRQSVYAGGGTSDTHAMLLLLNKQDVAKPCFNSQVMSTHVPEVSMYNDKKLANEKALQVGESGVQVIAGAITPVTITLGCNNADGRNK